MWLNAHREFPTENRLIFLLKSLGLSRFLGNRLDVDGFELFALKLKATPLLSSFFFPGDVESIKIYHIRCWVF